MIYNYTEVDNRIVKILDVLSKLGFSFEMFSEKRIIIIDNNVTFAEKRNIGVITSKGTEVSLKIYGYKNRGKLKSKMKNNEVVFKQNVTLSDVSARTRALIKKYRTAETSIFGESFNRSISTAYFVNPADITGLGYLNEYTINESSEIREATKEEAQAAYTATVENEIREYYGAYANNPRILNQIRQLGQQGFNYAWSHKFHAYTTTGEDLLLATLQDDGSIYVAMAYVPENMRGRAISIKAFKRLLDESPNGLSLHTNRNNRVVCGLCRHFGLQEYPCQSGNPSDILFATSREVAENNKLM